MPTPVKYGKLYMKDAEGTLVQILPQSNITIPNYTGATSSVAGSAGLVPAAQSAEREKFLRGDGTWAAAAEPVSDYAGATADASGTHGLVPAAASAERNNYLKGDGTWGSITLPSTYSGATGSANGTAGLVPAATIAEKDNYLKGDGTWTALTLPSDYAGATSNSAGTHGLVPAATSAEKDNYLKGDGTWGTVTTSNYVGATSNSAGTAGLVPAATSAQRNNYLKGDGTWGSITLPSTYSGATGSANGTAGLVPAATIAEKDNYLKGDGTWAALTLPSDYVGATAGASGTHGLVPAATSAQRNNYLKGDGTWGTVTTSNYVGATGSANGTAGLVPAATIAEKNNYLKGDGTWGTVSTTKEVSITTTEPNSSSIASLDNEGLIFYENSTLSDVASFVTTSGNQSIAGNKTFTDNLTVGGNVAITGTATCGGEEVIHVPATADAHNCIYRGKDLTNVYTLTELSAKLAQGDFSDLYIGDYITLPFAYTNASPSVNVSKNVNFRFAHFNYWMNKGYKDTNNEIGQTTANHILLIPDGYLFTSYMNATNTTEGGVHGSYLWGALQDGVYTALNASTCLDGHILAHSTILGKTVNTTAPSMAGGNWTGSTSAWQWYDEKVMLMSEVMVYGSTVFSSSAFDVGCRDSQVALFRIDPSWINSRSGRSGFWIGAAASSTYFCLALYNGRAHAGSASYSYGVRPAILFS